MKQIIVNCENLQTRVALVEDGKIQEYYIERKARKRIVGSIYKGRIKNLESSLQAAFVDIGLEKNAFLHYWDMIPATYDTWEAEEADGEPNGDDDDDLTRADDPETVAGRPTTPLADGDEADEDFDDEDDFDDDDESESESEDEDEDDDEPEETQTGSRGEPSNVPAAAKFHQRFRLFGGLFSRSAPPPPAVEPPAAPAAEPAPRSGRGERKRGRGRGDRRQSQGRSERRQGRRKRQEFDLTKIPELFTVNSEVVVQVSKGIIGEKGPRVTTNLSLPGRYVVLLPNSTHRGVSKRIGDRRERVRLRKMIQSIPLPRGMGLICRTASVGLEESSLREDVEFLLGKWQEAEHRKARRAPLCIYQEPDLLERCVRDMLPERIDEIVIDDRDAFQEALACVKRVDKKDRPRVRCYEDATPIFEHFRLDSQIQSIFRRKVALSSGAEVCIDETEALISIDINSSRSRGGKDHPETILNTNLEAADEVARQLRLRNVGGLVVVDFIDMRSRKDQQKVYRKMLQCTSKDRARTKILPISRLGLMEMTRQREHESLQDSTFDNCPYCRGRGLIKSSLSMSVEIQRRLQEVLRKAEKPFPIRVTVNPRVLARLKNEDAELLQDMEEEFGGELSFRSDAELHQEEFHLVDVGTGKEI